MGNSSDASINASEESVHEDSSSYGEDGTSMSVNGDVGVSSADDSDVEGGADAPAPAVNAAAPLVDIIEADASGNPPFADVYHVARQGRKGCRHERSRPRD